MIFIGAGVYQELAPEARLQVRDDQAEGKRSAGNAKERQTKAIQIIAVREKSTGVRVQHVGGQGRGVKRGVGQDRAVARAGEFSCQHSTIKLSAFPSVIPRSSWCTSSWGWRRCWRCWCSAARRSGGRCATPPRPGRRSTFEGRRSPFRSSTTRYPVEKNRRDA